jgi:hypothetical protein
VRIKRRISWEKLGWIWGVWWFQEEEKQIFGKD